MLHGSLDGKGVWGRMDTCKRMAESLSCSSETITTLLINYIPIQNKKLKKRKETLSFRDLAVLHVGLFYILSHTSNASLSWSS